MITCRTHTLVELDQVGNSFSFWSLCIACYQTVVAIQGCAVVSNRVRVNFTSYAVTVAVSWVCCSGAASHLCVTITHLIFMVCKASGLDSKWVLMFCTASGLDSKYKVLDDIPS